MKSFALIKKNLEEKYAYLFNPITDVNYLRKCVEDGRLRDDMRFSFCGYILAHEQSSI